jgi:hypothetical protein
MYIILLNFHSCMYLVPTYLPGFHFQFQQGRAGFEHNQMSSDSFICPYTVGFESAMCNTFLGCIIPMINSPGMELIFKGDLKKFILDKYSRNWLQSEKLMFLTFQLLLAEEIFQEAELKVSNCRQLFLRWKRERREREEGERGGRDRREKERRERENLTCCRDVNINFE